MIGERQEKEMALVKNICLFFLASFIPKTISFFLVPLYTHCLTTQEYGTIDLITATAQLLLPLLTLQIQDAVLRFTLDSEQTPARIYTTGLRIVAQGCGILLLTTGFIYVADLIRIDWPYILFFLVTFISGALNNITTYFLRALDKVRVITLTAIVNCVFTIGSNLIFLLVFRWGIKGYLLANSLGHILGVFLMFALGRLHIYVTREKPDRELTRTIISFSLPMIVSALSWWINHSLDKYILTYFCGVSAAGLLAVAYKIPTIISTFGAIISRAFSVSVVENFDARDEDGFLGQSYAKISFLLVLCTSCLIIINVPLSKFLFAKEFFVAWQIVPPLLLSAVMNYMSLSCEHIFIALKQTKTISATAIMGAGVNAILNFCLIPILEYYGAAISTAISFTVVWLLRYVWVRKRVDLKNYRIKEPISYGILFAQMALSYYGNRYVWMQMLFAIALVALYSKEIINVLKSTKTLIEKRLV